MPGCYLVRANENMLMAKAEFDLEFVTTCNELHLNHEVRAKAIKSACAVSRK
jgi:DNA-dependent RNA polymerase auxiliary subunit epsilon